MGEQADFLTDSMLEGKAAHDRGECDYGCEWCEDGDDHCPKCGGSGGGDDPVLRCRTCGGSGLKRVRPKRRK